MSIVSPTIDPSDQSRNREHRAPSRKQNLAEKTKDAAGNSVITEDLATFYLAHKILVSGESKISYSEFMEHLSGYDELKEVALRLIHQLEECGAISVSNDEIQIIKHEFDLGRNAQQLKRFLPNLLRVLSKRTLKLAESDPSSFSKNRNGIHYLALPDDPETSLEVQAAFNDFRTRLNSIFKKCVSEERASNDVRVVGFVSSILNVEDVL